MITLMNSIVGARDAKDMADKGFIVKGMPGTSCFMVEPQIYDVLDWLVASAAEYELLVLIREFDERAGWLKWGFANCTDGLHYRCDMSSSTAREKVGPGRACAQGPARDLSGL